MKINAIIPIRPRAAEPPEPDHQIDRDALWISALPPIILIALWPTAGFLWSFWMSDGGYSHALPVIAMSMVAAFRMGRRLDWNTTRPSFWGWCALAATSFVWLTATLLEVSAIYSGLYPIILVCVIWSVLGGHSAQRLTIPSSILFSALPVWDPVTAVLQTMSVKASGALLNLLGIPAALDGIYVYIPSGVFKVESGCSGISYFIVALAIGLYLGVSEELRARKIILVTAILSGTAIVANWIRIVLIIAVGHVTNMQHTLIVDGHQWFGWVVFGLFLLGALWVVSTRLLAMPENAPRRTSDTYPARSLHWPGLQAALALATLAIVATLSSADALQPIGQGVDVRWPESTGGYRLQEPGYASAWNPSYPGANSESRATYRLGRRTLETYAACYTKQSNGQELVGYHSSPAGENVEYTARQQVDDPRFSRLRWRLASGDTWTAEQTYVIDRDFTGSPTVAKLLNLGLVSSGPAPVCTLLVAARCDLGCDDAAVQSRELATLLVRSEPFLTRSD